MSSRSDFCAIVVAAGASTRFGGSTPKQFQLLGGSTVLEHSVRALADSPDVAGVVVVLPEAEVDGPWGRQVLEWPEVQAVTPGGATRADSVRAGLAHVVDSSFVLVHDAGRPMLGPATIRAVIDGTRRVGAAIPALAVSDTVKEVGSDDCVRKTVPRQDLRLAQTPQGARTVWLRQALERAHQSGRVVTDEAAALEFAGHPVLVVPGDPRNRKLTTADDLERARMEMTETNDGPEYRVGSGFDIHRGGADRPLVLGGVRFEDHPGLVGHSDADVILHAAMDALLGGAGLGDIGVQFPPEDPCFAGADSRELARTVARLVDERGFRVVNLDLTLLSEGPRIRERREEMRRAIAECLSMEPDRVGLKATTLEKLGALGRGEGMACQAAALLVRRRPRS